MFTRLFANRTTFRLVLSISLASALVPTAFCGYQLFHIRGDLAATQDAAQLASAARGLVDKISQSQFNLAAAPLDLSAGERDALYRQTDANLATLKAAVGSAKSLTGAFLDKQEQADLLDSVDEFAHSWAEIKEGLADGMTEPEKAYHFLNIFDQSARARSILVKLEKSATLHADSFAAASIAGANDITWMLGIIFVLSSFISTAALIGNYRYAASVRQANDELGEANASLRLRDSELRGQNERFDAALENMSQGLSMFDASAGLIVCNRRYRDMYGLGEDWKPGTPLADLIAHKARRGDCPGGDHDAFARMLERGLTSKEPFATTIATLNGRPSAALAASACRSWSRMRRRLARPVSGSVCDSAMAVSRAWRSTRSSCFSAVTSLNTDSSQPLPSTVSLIHSQVPSTRSVAKLRSATPRRRCNTEPRKASTSPLSIFTPKPPRKPWRMTSAKSAGSGRPRRNSASKRALA